MRLVHVAVGVIADYQGNILIAKRPDTSHQGGLWEFPGGKVETGETVFSALQRELREELAIEITRSQPLIKIHHDYGDKRVLLDVHRVDHFSGKPIGNEGQPIAWVAPEALAFYEFPVANRPIITAIRLPPRLLITGEFLSLDDLLQRTERALGKNVRLVQLRLPLPHKEQSLLDIVAAMSKLCQKHAAQLMVNTSVELFNVISEQHPSVGLHLNSAALLACETRPIPSSSLLGASCHNRTEAELAQKIGVDFVCLSPVLHTSSHPDAMPLGWEIFADLCETINRPVFALGGMKEMHLLRAQAAGAQGIAAIGEWWN